MKNNFIKTMVMFPLLAVVLLAVCCKKPVETVVPKVNIMEQSVAIGHNIALLCAEVTDDGGALVTERGFCYSKMDGSVDTVWCEEGSDTFSIELANLVPSTTYTCKAFAVNEAGWGYSAEYVFTTLDYPYPVVKTYFPTDVTITTAMVTGRVVSDGGLELTERGICYSTEESVTINDSHVISGSGVGEYTCQLTGLQPSTVYYARAYAISAEGVYYGEELGFVTECLPMEVRTIAVTDVTATRVKGEGEVIRDGCYEVKERGFCWGTKHQPTIEGLHQKVSKGVGEYSYYFSGLERGRTHYMRAYAINEKGVVYGEEVEFVPDDPFLPWPNGTLPGLFSVSEDRQVRFSQGNLQYCPDNDIWRFAERQWDFVGGDCWDRLLDSLPMGTVYANGVRCNNALIWKYYEGWMDLFGWGTSGWDNGNIYYKPYDKTSHSYDCAFYGPPGNYDLTGDYVQADWGIHNTISNGGSRQWRTPSADEVDYLLRERVTPSGIRFVKAIVAGIRGLVVLPDDWNASIYHFNAINMNFDYFENIITGGEWLDVLEPAGAVFLPAAGWRFQPSGETWIWYENGESFSYDCCGHYWTTTQGVGVDKASAWFFYYDDFDYTYNEGFINPHIERCDGGSVRLISDE